VNPSPHKLLARTGFARTIAERLHVESLVWTIRNVAAWCAANLLWRIVTSRNAVARAAALLRCVSVESAGRQDVYCLTVPGPSAFCLANGAVVHNTRFLLIGGVTWWRRKEPKGARQSKDVFAGRPGLKGGRETLGWMG
jgi:hypothetical protein